MKKRKQPEYEVNPVIGFAAKNLLRAVKGKPTKDKIQELEEKIKLKHLEKKLEKLEKKCERTSEGDSK